MQSLKREKQWDDSGPVVLVANCSLEIALFSASGVLGTTTMPFSVRVDLTLSTAVGPD